MPRVQARSLWDVRLRPARRRFGKAERRCLSLISDFQRTHDFYTKYFNLKATDLLTAPDGTYVAGFFHVDREEEWVDHHTFFFSANPTRVGPHHCSFEVHDPDIQAIGHDVGRDILV